VTHLQEARVACPLKGSAHIEVLVLELVPSPNMGAALAYLVDSPVLIVRMNIRNEENKT
jgi:hypothetical protein